MRQRRVRLEAGRAIGQGGEGDRVLCVSRRGAVEAVVTLTDSLLRGVVTLAHGFGLDYPDTEGKLGWMGPRINGLTSAGWCDPFVGIAYHKYVPVKLERMESH